MKAIWPLDHTIKVRQKVQASKDVFGNVTTGWGPDTTIKVLGWAEPSEEELVTAENAGRVIWDIDVLAPSGAVSITDRLVIDGQVYEVTKISNFDHGPKSWLVPGLDVIHVKQVKG